MAILFLPFFAGVDGNGLAMAGAKIQFYQTGTTTPLDTYTSSTLATPNANPVVADANGLFPAIYLAQTTDYKAILMTSASVTVATRDPLLTTKPITTRGDIITGGASGVDQRLALGTAGQDLSSDGTDVIWRSKATQTDQETATSVLVSVTPGRQQYHASAAKGWCVFDGTGTVAIKASYNTTSLTDYGIGNYSLTWTVAFSGNFYGVNISSGATAAGQAPIAYISLASASGSQRVQVLRGDTRVVDDASIVSVAVFGDQ